MQVMKTVHATIRAQQRGVPPLIEDWLLDYGAEQFDGHGVSNTVKMTHGIDLKVTHLTFFRNA